MALMDLQKGHLRGNKKVSFFWEMCNNNLFCKLILLSKAKDAHTSSV